jgi:hypothetical protein
MVGRTGLGLMLLMLSASCSTPSLDVRSASANIPTSSSVTIPLDDPVPAGPPRLTYRLTSLVGEMLSWSPFHRRPRLANAGDDALGCLTAAVYYEARSEPENGQRAVVQVVLNRVGKPSFAGSVCGVTHQRSAASGDCQFGFICDGAERRHREAQAWATATRIAREALDGDTFDPVGTATFYHSVSVSPGWSHRFVRVATIGSHIFYRTHSS